MAKKSTQKRQNQSARGAANRSSAGAATLVRPTRLGMADAETTAPTNTAAPVSKPSAASVVRDTPAKLAPKPAPAASAKPAAAKAPAAKASATATAPTGGKRLDTRVARARATQQARRAGMISAENYSYVLQDLKLVGVLAVCAVIALVALTFTLPH